MKSRLLPIASVVLTLVAALAVGSRLAVSPKTPEKKPVAAKARVHREPGEHLRSKVGQAGEESHEALERDTQYAEARTAPGIVLPGAYGAAFASLSGLSATSGNWTEVTNRPYDSDDPRYRDPYFSNSGGGSGFVSGRCTGIAVDGNGNIYAAGANGGVFRSTNNGATWTPMTDGLPTLSVGDLRIAPDGALWLATGEGNTGSTAYVGSGVYRLARPANSVFTMNTRVGGAELESTFINKIKFDDAGNAYAASSRGLWKHSNTTANGAWRRVLYPVPDPADPSQQSPYNNIVNDVEVQPGTHGQNVIANAAWRGGAAYNGFYLSTDGGSSFTKINPGGAINPQDIGNTEFAYSSDGSKLYAIMESITKYTNNSQTALSGIYSSDSGTITGPWNKIADSGNLSASGSALQSATFYHPGVQAWYNNFIAVDPGNALHVFAGLEEVYETLDGGVHWAAIGPYWNFDFPCYPNDCNPTTHSDQHAIAFGNGKVYVGNDGGLYARPILGSADKSGHATDWQNLNANLRTLQYYSVGVGRVPGGWAVSGGLQDNGGSLLLPEDATGNMGSPFGGDGGDTLVDPDDGCKILAEYVYLSLELTTTCGRSSGAPGAIRDVSPGDPNPRFIAPFRADGLKKDHWVAGGQYVWSNTKGFAIQSGSEWARLFDNGAGHSTTTLASYNDVVYSAWCGPCNPDGFARGISTNAGGTFRQLTLPAAMPNRYISGLVVDGAADPTGKTAYVGFNGFSRVWTEGPGAGIGHLWKTTDGGATWTDVSGNLPDVPVNDIVISRGNMVVGTDLGVVVRAAGSTSWKRLGGNFPYTTVMDLSLAPNGLVYAATHGRGIWSIPAP